MSKTTEAAIFIAGLFIMTGMMFLFAMALGDVMVTTGFIKWR
jgi:hypothetical protein